MERLLTDPVVVKIKQLHAHAIFPKYQTPGSAGVDLHACEDCEIWMGAQAIIPTGIAMAIPPGYEGQIRPRSGLAAKNLITVLNSPGTIDCFSEDSMISTVGGRKSVHDLRINDAIFSFNEETLEIEKDIISAIVDVGEKPVIIFTMDDGKTLTVTPGTIVYTKSGPKRAEDINIDDELLFDHDI